VSIRVLLQVPLDWEHTTAALTRIGEYRRPAPRDVRVSALRTSLNERTGQVIGSLFDVGGSAIRPNVAAPADRAGIRAVVTRMVVYPTSSRAIGAAHNGFSFDWGCHEIPDTSPSVLCPCIFGVDTLFRLHQGKPSVRLHQVTQRARGQALFYIRAPSSRGCSPDPRNPSIGLEKIAALRLQTDAPGPDHRDVSDDFRSTIEDRHLANCENFSARHSSLLSDTLHPNFYGFCQSVSNCRYVHTKPFWGGCLNDSIAK